MILAKTIKGYSLGAHFQGRNATHQMKKLTNDNADQLVAIFVGFALGYMILVAIISAVANLLERRAAVA